MLRTDFGKKCIIVQFLGMKKDRKSPQRRVRRDAEKRFERAMGTKEAGTDFDLESELGISPLFA
jgi:hypothetical protein